MKKINILLLAIIAAVSFSCSGGGSNGSSNNDNNAVCIWDNISLKDAPEESGKWLCSISIGETVEYLDKTKEDNSGKKKVTYIKVGLKDGKEGWVQSDFVIVGGKAGAITETAEIYSRPNLLNKTGNSFSPMDIVAVKSEKDGFIEVVGKRKTGKWIESGWLKTKSITYSDVDIAVAKFASKALEISDIEKRNKAITEIVNNPDFSNSIFLNLLPVAEEKKVEAAPTDTTTNAD